MLAVCVMSEYFMNSEKVDWYRITIKRSSGLRKQKQGGTAMPKKIAIELT